MKTMEFDALVIGTGLSGCCAAMALAEAGHRVCMITRSSRPEESASFWAQGGIAYSADDQNQDADRISFQKDILAAGAGISNEKAVSLLVSEGPSLIEEVLLKKWNVPFDRNPDGSYRRAEEGAHSVARILHIADETGKGIETSAISHVANLQGVEVLSEHTAIDLLTLSHHSTNPQDQYERPRCIGAYVWNRKSNEVLAILAKQTILASGGLGQLYLHTTNPEGARGDGLAMAYRTGARIMNLEYIQFHPTALFLKRSSKRFLITEAMRGEGARLINQSGQPFMQRYDPRGELAPRDIVARGIHDEMLRQGDQWVYLDITHRPAEWIQSRFPTIYRECKGQGIDICHEPIPVVPAAHYSCGGVAVDLEGRTTIENLWAVGEVSCTGVHGANRLASTSLLEDLVWGIRAGEAAGREILLRTWTFPNVREWISRKDPIDHDLILQDWLTIQHTMWNYVGLVRTPKRLRRARRTLRELAEEIDQYYEESLVSDALIGLRNGVMSAQLVLTAARRNRHSIGAHFLREEFTETNAAG